MTTFHRVLGTTIVLGFLVVMVTTLLLRVARRAEAPVALRAVQHWTENLLAVQVVTGIVLLLLGRRVVGGPVVWLHYLYGSLFPLIAVVGGRLASLRRERYAYLGLGWGSFFALGLTLRALQTACGTSLADLGPCLTR